jgi:hypothetical protein
LYGFELTIINVNHQGHVRLEDVRNALKKNTIIVFYHGRLTMKLAALTDTGNRRDCPSILTSGFACGCKPRYRQGATPISQH